MVHLRQFKVYLEEKSQMWNTFVAFFAFSHRERGRLMAELRKEKDERIQGNDRMLLDQLHNKLWIRYNNKRMVPMEALTGKYKVAWDRLNKEINDLLVAFLTANLYRKVTPEDNKFYTRFIQLLFDKYKSRYSAALKFIPLERREKILLDIRDEMGACESSFCELLFQKRQAGKEKNADEKTIRFEVIKAWNEEINPQTGITVA